jgi:hypothetical protein
VEFVEADEPPALGDPRGHRRQRIDFAFERIEVRVDVAHERMEVDTDLAPDRHRHEETVHQEALAAAHASPEVDAARHVRRVEQARQRRLPCGAKDREFVGQLLQPVERRGLRVVERRPAPGKQRLEIINERALAARNLSRGERPGH